MNRLIRQHFAIAVVAGFAWMGAQAAAQERPGPIAELAVGSLTFPDDGSVTETFVGGAVRFHVSPRVSVGPEVAYVSGDKAVGRLVDHSHLMLTGNATFDFLSPVNGRPRQVTPFFVAGGGLFRTREQFPNDVFTHTEGAFTAGGGVRALVGDRVTIGIETRIGWELHVRVNGMVGVRLSD